MPAPPTKSSRFAIALIGIALSGFSLYGFGTHEFTLRRSTGRVQSEHRLGRPREVTFSGWPADVIRLGLATVGFLFVSYSYASDRHIAVRNGLIAIVVWLGVSCLVFAWWTIGS